MSQAGTITTSLTTIVGDPYARTRYRNVLKENPSTLYFGIKDCRHVSYLASNGHIVRALQYLAVMIADRPRATASAATLYAYCCEMQEYYIKACQDVAVEPTPTKRRHLDYYSLPALTRRLSTVYPDRLFDIMSNLPDASPNDPPPKSLREAAMEFHRQVLARSRREQAKSGKRKVKRVRSINVLRN